MSAGTCPTCGAEVSPSARACPACGHVLRRAPRGCFGQIWMGLFLLFQVAMIGVIAATVFGDAPAAPTLSGDDPITALVSGWLLLSVLFGIPAWLTRGRK